MIALCTLLLLVSSITARVTQFRVDDIYRRKIDELHQSDLDGADAPPEPPQYWFEQRIDHFSKDNLSTFKQLYYLQTSFYKPGGPIYLYNGGEAALRPWSLKGHLESLANMTHGAIVAMEHRYYGASIPTKDLSAESLQYLTTRQALADMAHFIRTTKEITGIGKLPVNTKWIVVGGSYPGNLAAWMRLKYPSLVFAAYSSSAPVKAKRDFYEYDQAVGAGLPAPCSDALSRVVEYVDDALTKKDPEQGKALRALFGLEVVKLDQDFASALTDAPSYIVQYGGYGGNWTSRFCEAMVPSTTENNTAPAILERFGKFQQVWMKENELNATDYNGTPNSIKLEDNKKGSRQWFYQVCTEYGYWQVAPPSPMKRWRSRLIDVDYYESGCRDAFGPSIKSPNTDYVNMWYRAQSIHATRVVHVNGELDPWRRLSVSAAPDSPAPPRTPNSWLEPMLVVKGGSHCTDLGSWRAKDSASLNATRHSVDKAIVQWLRLEK